MDMQKQPESSRAPARAQETADAAAVVVETDSQQLSPRIPTVDELADEIEAKPEIATAKTMRDAIVAIPSIRAVIVSAAVRCLGAKRLMFDRESKSVVSVDDGATIMKAVAWLSAYSDGLPVQTTMNLNVDGNKDMPAEEMLAKSPALVAALERQLARAKAVQKTGGALPAPSPSGAG